MKTKQQVVAEFRRSGILDSARTVFAGATIDDIAREAQVAKGTVYLYFPSKMEIYRAALESYMDSLKQAKKDFFRIMDSEPGNLSHARRQYHAWLEHHVLKLTAAIEDGMRRGDIPWPRSPGRGQSRPRLGVLEPLVIGKRRRVVGYRR